MSNELENVRQMFADYEEQKNPSGKNKKFENVLSKYFIPTNPKEYFRMLPPNKGEKIVEIAYFHQIKVNGPKGETWKKIYCLKKNGDLVPKLDSNGQKILDQQGNPVMVQRSCPFCDKQQEWLNKQDKTILSIPKETMTPEQKQIFDKNKEYYKESGKYEANKFYIIAGIDRMAEKDGKKFWRFKDSYKKNGILDKLMPVLNDFVDYKKADFTSPVNGADLSITVVDASMPNGRKYKDVSAITIREQSPLHNDTRITEQFLSDDCSWRDVFKPAMAPNVTPEEYMVLALNGQSPYWDDSDQKNKHWVFPGRPDLEEKAKNRESTQSSNSTVDTNTNVDNLNSKIGNLTQNDVGVYPNDHTMLGGVVEDKKQPQNNTTTSDEYQEEYDGSSFDDDLPF